ncbi:uncharacterized protein BDR25DRAFT_392778 [Lindgomyces ingoldianus]|uniref:Uncharacterized protein n=1 Tax=Lindgomyces ingoldianus TaxID=673940 RepID=A0ACB6R1M4_9PLEO|nr:uncharacterized protein BDR25DRAFT_392778 [Lindgomyces ingoldianus]KAF2472995.1 hypothetical protein BDR25DRAFT_392778 [Lindgomyces ingoldianus]
MNSSARHFASNELSDSDFQESHSSTTSGQSSGKDESKGPSKRLLHSPNSSCKRRKQSGSDSVEFFPDTKRHLQGQYINAYRTLFNESVNDAVHRFVSDASFIPPRAQIGASRWSMDEKSRFFAALDRLGRGDLPGIARAVRTKTIPEIQNLFLLLENSTLERKITSQDISAATEVSPACIERLEVAGDALAWYQERFEAKAEQDRYGKYWLVTPEIADQIEEAIRPSRTPSLSLPLDSRNAELEDSSPVRNASTPNVPEILQHIPEASLLKPSALLTLSKSLFMNSSPILQPTYPHWTDLISPLASEPSIYRTAFIDFHTLVLSLTKRITQATIIQATSRIRSQSWRIKKGVSPLVKRRDVLTAVDMLGLKRNGRERWKGVARRCRLRVFDGAGKSKREVDWDEIEAIMGIPVQPKDFADADSSGKKRNLSSGEDEDDFKWRARRSGTPLPRESLAHSENDDESRSDKQCEDEGSGRDSSGSSQTSQSSARNTTRSPSKPPHSSPDAKLDMILEDLDQEASREEERRLWEILGDTQHPIKEPRKTEENPLPKFSDDNTANFEGWRGWTEYYAEWEEFCTPVPEVKFLENRKLPRATTDKLSNPDATTSIYQGSNNSDRDGQSDRNWKKSRKANAPDIPIRDAHDEGVSDDAKMLVDSIENAHMQHRDSLVTQMSDYVMEVDMNVERFLFTVHRLLSGGTSAHDHSKTKASFLHNFHTLFSPDLRPPLPPYSPLCFTSHKLGHFYSIHNLTVLGPRLPFQDIQCPANCQDSWYNGTCLKISSRTSRGIVSTVKLGEMLEENEEDDLRSVATQAEVGDILGNQKGEKIRKREGPLSLHQLFTGRNVLKFSNRTLEEEVTSTAPTVRSSQYGENLDPYFGNDTNTKQIQWPPLDIDRGRLCLAKNATPKPQTPKSLVVINLNNRTRLTLRVDRTRSFSFFLVIKWSLLVGRTGSLIFLVLKNGRVHKLAPLLSSLRNILASEGREELLSLPFALPVIHRRLGISEPVRRLARRSPSRNLPTALSIRMTYEQHCNRLSVLVLVNGEIFQDVDLGLGGIDNFKVVVDVMLKGEDCKFGFIGFELNSHNPGNGIDIFSS